MYEIHTVCRKTALLFSRLNNRNRVQTRVKNTSYSRAFAPAEPIPLRPCPASWIDMADRHHPHTAFPSRSCATVHFYRPRATACPFCANSHRSCTPHHLHTVAARCLGSVPVLLSYGSRMALDRFPAHWHVKNFEIGQYIVYHIFSLIANSFYAHARAYRPRHFQAVSRIPSEPL